MFIWLQKLGFHLLFLVSWFFNASLLQHLTSQSECLNSTDHSLSLRSISSSKSHSHEKWTSFWRRCTFAPSSFSCYYRSPSSLVYRWSNSIAHIRLRSRLRFNRLRRAKRTSWLSKDLIVQLVKHVAGDLTLISILAHRASIAKQGGTTLVDFMFTI